MHLAVLESCVDIIFKRLTRRLTFEIRFALREKKKRWIETLETLWQHLCVANVYKNSETGLETLIKKHATALAECEKNARAPHSKDPFARPPPPPCYWNLHILMRISRLGKKHFVWWMPPKEQLMQIFQREFVWWKWSCAMNTQPGRSPPFCI